MPAPTFIQCAVEASQRPRSRSPSVEEGAEPSAPLTIVLPEAPTPSAFSPVSEPASGRKRVRGPWDHSGTISLQFDIGALLTPPKRAAVSP
jgi:hypothetical protein